MGSAKMSHMSHMSFEAHMSFERTEVSCIYVFTYQSLTAMAENQKYMWDMWDMFAVCVDM